MSAKAKPITVVKSTVKSSPVAVAKSKAAPVPSTPVHTVNIKGSPFAVIIVTQPIVPTTQTYGWKSANPVKSYLRNGEGCKDVTRRVAGFATKEAAAANALGAAKRLGLDFTASDVTISEPPAGSRLNANVVECANIANGLFK